MTAEHLQLLAKQVVELSVVFGPMVMLVMELLKPVVKGRRPRRLLSGLLSVLFPALYLSVTGVMPMWPWALVVAVLAWGISQGGHKLRNFNEAVSHE